MKDEIKEMLQEIKETVDDYLKIYKLEDDMMYDTINYKASQWYALLDYITNLQEENERLKENAIHNDKVVDKAKWNEMLYKSRIEKAIEYLEKSMNNPQPYYKYLFGDENGKVENLDKLLNILQGGKND